jgi:dihydrolipoamide dehydrogenase
MQDVFDLIIIGAGPGGYTGAIKAAQLGMRVACIEKRTTLGGTCLNVGCIPSKALLHFSKTYDHALHNFSQMGIKAQVSLDLNVMIEKKNQIVTDLCRGIEGLFAKNKVQKFTGQAKIIGPNEVIIDNKIQLTASNILIATGSEVATLPNVNIDERRILSSTAALSLRQVPEKMVVIGGGYIGLELGSVWRRLGSSVVVIEYGDRLLSMMDDEIAQELHKSLEKQGINFMLGTKVNSAISQENEVELLIESLTDSTTQKITANVALVAVGRRPFTSGLGLQDIKVGLDTSGKIIVDSSYRTNIKSIFAIGDVISGPSLAHKAEEESIAAVEIMAGQKGHVNYRLIPSVIYTDPEVASVGATERDLKKTGIEYKVGKFPFLANSKAKTSLNLQGFVKILADKHSDLILGAHIIGQEAGVLINEITVGMEFSASAEDIARTCHPHPTLSEAVRQAALAVDGKAINF